MFHPPAHKRPDSRCNSSESFHSIGEQLAVHQLAPCPFPHTQPSQPSRFALVSPHLLRSSLHHHGLSSRLPPVNQCDRRMISGRGGENTISHDSEPRGQRELLPSISPSADCPTSANRKHVTGVLGPPRSNSILHAQFQCCRYQIPIKT